MMQLNSLNLFIYYKGWTVLPSKLTMNIKNRMLFNQRTHLLKPSIKNLKHAPIVP